VQSPALIILTSTDVSCTLHEPLVDLAQENIWDDVAFNVDMTVMKETKYGVRLGKEVPSAASNEIEIGLTHMTHPWPGSRPTRHPI
jgi:hypothetical protein